MNNSPSIFDVISVLVLGAICLACAVWEYSIIGFQIELPELAVSFCIGFSALLIYVKSNIIALIFLIIVPSFFIGFYPSEILARTNPVLIVVSALGVYWIWKMVSKIFLEKQHPVKER